MKRGAAAPTLRPLSGLDGAFLHLETPETPMHVASLHVFDLPKGYRGGFYARVRRTMERRLHLAPIFERRLAPMPLQFANPAWVHDDAVDLDWHVQRVTLPAPGGQAELEDLAARLHGELLDRTRPLWRLYVIEGLADGQAGYYIKVHHAALDGQAGVLLANALFDLGPVPRATPRSSEAARAPRIAAPARGVRARGPGQGVRGFEPQAAPATRPGAAELAAAALRHDVGQYVKFVRHLPEVLRTLGGMLGGGGESRGRDRARARDTRSAARAFGPRTALNVPISGERGFAALSLPLDSLKRLARAHDAKLNDVVLALASGALRRWLARHGGIPREALIAAMPISLRAPGNTEYTTQATMSLVNLHTHIADPVRRLRAIRDSATAVKSVAGRVKGIVPTDFPSIAVPWILHALASLYGRTRLAAAIPPIANVVISNVPGPQVPLYAAGARMRTYWPMSIVEHGLGLNLTVMSYAGAMGFGFTTAREAVPDARELSKALEEAFAELVARSKPRAGGRAITAPVRNANAARRESRGSIRKSAASARKSGLSARKSAALVRKSAASSRESATRTRKATTPR